MGSCPYGMDWKTLFLHTQTTNGYIYGYTGAYMSISGYTGAYMGMCGLHCILQGCTWVYYGYTQVYMGIQWYTGLYEYLSKYTKK